MVILRNVVWRCAKGWKVSHGWFSKQVSSGGRSSNSNLGIEMHFGCVLYETTWRQVDFKIQTPLLESLVGLWVILKKRSIPLCEVPDEVIPRNEISRIVTLSMLSRLIEKRKRNKKKRNKKVTLSHFSLPVDRFDDQFFERFVPDTPCPARFRHAHCHEWE